jgi:hypothetical protein
MPKHMNWFLVVNTFLTLGAGISFILNSELKLGLLQLTFTISNIIFLWMGMK